MELIVSLVKIVITPRNNRYFFEILNKRGNKVFNVRAVEEDLSQDIPSATFTNKTFYTETTLFIISYRR